VKSPFVLYSALAAIAGKAKEEAPKVLPATKGAVAGEAGLTCHPEPCLGKTTAVYACGESSGKGNIPESSGVCLMTTFNENEPGGHWVYTPYIRLKDGRVIYRRGGGVFRFWVAD
jgi:hypothetical protein